MSPELLEINVTVETKETEIIVDPEVPQQSVLLETVETYVRVDDTPDVIVVASGGLGPEGPPGPAGVEGPPGPQGPMGPEGAQSTFVFTQTAAASEWDITHNLDRYPSVTVVDSGGSEVIPDVRYVSSDVLILTFANPTSGQAYLN